MLSILMQQAGSVALAMAGFQVADVTFAVTCDTNGSGVSSGGGPGSLTCGFPAAPPGANALSVGNYSLATGRGDAAIGTTASASAGDLSGLPPALLIEPDADGRATAIGTQAIAVGDGTLAVGDQASVGFVATSNAIAAVDGGTAIGSRARVTAGGGTAIGAGAIASAADSVAIGANSVAAQANTVSIGTVGGERRIVNVLAGVAATDAVNVGQLTSATTALAENLSFDLRDARRDARAGTSAALAAAGLPQAMDAGRTMIAGGVGTYRGRAAFAVGASHRLPSGNAVAKVGMTYDSSEHVGANAGVGFQF